MAKGNLLEIYYDRVVSTEEITLTIDNCEQYGYVSTTKEINGVETIVYYEQGKNEDDYLLPDENGLTIIEYNTYQRYTHIAPPCSTYEPNFADVDKEGSGRNSLTGEMFRERIGSYSMLNVAWNLIPNTKEYNNWYKILTHLPPMVYLRLLMPTGEIVDKKMYRGDINTKLYLFVEDNQIWQGLSTTFTQWDIDEYDDKLEPNLEEV